MSGILRNGHLQTMVTFGSNFEAIEPVGTARRWSKEDKYYARQGVNMVPAFPIFKFKV